MGGKGGGGGTSTWQPAYMDIVEGNQLFDYYTETGDSPDADGNPNLVKLKEWKMSKQPFAAAAAPEQAAPAPAPAAAPEPAPAAAAAPEPAPAAGPPPISAGGAVEQPKGPTNTGDALGGAVLNPPNYWVGGIGSYNQAKKSGSLKTTQT